ncbi:hypothetical protein ACNR9V_09635 [Parageobacillus thermoglucosidasius]|uniref:hypothetical protein n=1 Tax=Parageobacillus thermoglucosidasius TaxID=1426 RepID=UPI003B66BC74
MNFSEWRSYLPVIAYFVLGLIVIWKDPLKVVWLFTWMKIIFSKNTFCQRWERKNE